MQKNNSLDFTPAQFRELLDKASQLITERFENLESAKVFQGVSPAEMHEQFDEPLIKGALVSIDEKRARARLLPFERKV